MINCPKCGEKFSFKARKNCCFDKDKILVCYNCDSYFRQFRFLSEITSIIAVILFLVTAPKITAVLRIYIEKEFIVLSIIAIIGVIWIIGIEYLSQFFSKYKEI